MKWHDVRTPADPQDYETTASRKATPPAEFTATRGVNVNVLTVTDRLKASARGFPTAAYRVYFLDTTGGALPMESDYQRKAGLRLANLVTEIAAPGNGTTFTVNDPSTYGRPGWFFCVAVSQGGQESSVEHCVRAPL